MNTRSILSWVVAVPVALLFGLTGLAKLGGAAGQMFIDWGYPAWFAYVIGAVEAFGALLLLIPQTMRGGVYLLTVVMVGAALTHIINAEGLAVLRPTIFAAAMWGALYLRSSAGEAMRKVEQAGKAA